MRDAAVQFQATHVPPGTGDDQRDAYSWRTGFVPTSNSTSHCRTASSAMQGRGAGAGCPYPRRAGPARRQLSGDRSSTTGGCARGTTPAQLRGAGGWMVDSSQLRARRRVTASTTRRARGPRSRAPVEPSTTVSKVAAGTERGHRPARSRRFEPVEAEVLVRHRDQGRRPLVAPLELGVVEVVVEGHVGRGARYARCSRSGP